MATKKESPESKTAAMRNRELALAKIDQARSILNEAAQLTSSLRGFSTTWKRIGDHADKTKALWHRVNNAKHPTGHDQY